MTLRLTCSVDRTCCTRHLLRLRNHRWSDGEVAIDSDGDECISCTYRTLKGLACTDAHAAVTRAWTSAGLYGIDFWPRGAAGESQHWLVERAPHRGTKVAVGCLVSLFPTRPGPCRRILHLNARFNGTMNRTRRANQVTGPLYRFTSSCSPWAKSH